MLLDISKIFIFYECKIKRKKLKDVSISFYLDIYLNGKRSYEFLNIHIPSRSLSKDDKEKRELAKQIRAEREYDLLVKENGIDNKKKKLSSFYDFYCNFINSKPKNTYGTALYTLNQYLGDNTSLSFKEITVDWIRDYSKFLTKDLSPNTAILYMQSIRGAINQAIREGIISSNPFQLLSRADKIKPKDPEIGFFTLDELQSLVNADTTVPLQSRQGFLLSCFTGLRWSDLNKLEWKDLLKMRVEETETFVLDFRQKKTKGKEYLPLSLQALNIIFERKEQAANEKEQSKYIFPSLVETPERKRYETINNHIKKWASDAGITKRIHFHMGRHTFATMTLNYGADLFTVSKLLGHCDIQHTMKYAKITDKTKKTAVNNLPVVTRNKIEVDL